MRGEKGEVEGTRLLPGVKRDEQNVLPLNPFPCEQKDDHR
jgi:hypothetical protein